MIDDVHRMYRRNDPDTSKQAAQELAFSGGLGERQQQVLRILVEYPTHTHAELAAEMYRQYPQMGIICCAESPHKRLPELKRKGLAKSVDTRRCTETGKEAAVWVPTELGAKEASFNKSIMGV